jgi:hypothetical protein
MFWIVNGFKIVDSGKAVGRIDRFVARLNPARQRIGPDETPKKTKDSLVRVFGAAFSIRQFVDYQLFVTHEEVF